MNKKQWFVLQIGFLLIMFFFIKIDTSPMHCRLDDVWCVMQAEMFDPFIYLLFGISNICLVCGWLEPKL